jgi:hypothetical protein
MLRASRVFIDGIFMIGGHAKQPYALGLLPSAQAISAVAASHCAPIEPLQS